MTSIKIDRPFLRSFTGEAEAALSEIAEKYGVTLTYKSATFARDGSNAIVKFEILAPNAQGETLTREAKDFKRFAKQYGLEPEDFGSEFKVGGETFRITGLKTRRPKYPIAAERVKDGRGCKFTVGQVKGSASPNFVEGLTPEIKKAFVGLASRLSPENLTCDGECSASEIRRRKAFIVRQWGELERRAGVKVSESEAWRLDFRHA